ncbi:hypothetical protein HY386_01360 [Candidatus Daviesbacteria bacterium]|nr:hypothetical protein [Candidatus Daviesbacteria bacterium]
MAVESDQEELEVYGIITEIESRVCRGVLSMDVYNPKDPLIMKFAELREAVKDLARQGGDLRGSNNHHQGNSSLLARFMLFWRR